MRLKYRCLYLGFSCTLGAQPLEHIVDVAHLEVGRQRHHWHMDAAQAHGAMAALTVEVCVKIVEVLAFLAAMTA